LLVGLIAATSVSHDIRYYAGEDIEKLHPIRDAYEVHGFVRVASNALLPCYFRRRQ
jgi:hypothetical protein